MTIWVLILFSSPLPGTEKTAATEAAIKTTMISAFMISSIESE